MKSLIVRFVREEKGQDLIEYALLAAILALGSVAVLGPLSNSIEGVFTEAKTQLDTATP